MSFTGLSTQYVVRTGWGQDLAVFAQNDGSDVPASRGDEVVVAWRPGHTFPLRDESPVDEVETAPLAGAAR